MTVNQNIDAVVVGAGMGGILSTYRLSRAGLTVQCVDIAGDVGGAWYWNKYPGAMCDSETYVFRYSWDKEDLQTYPWTHHYAYQPEILDYLRHVVKKHDLRKYMAFETEVEKAAWDEQIKRWTIECRSRGEQKTYQARYFILCLGLLSKPSYPDIPGIKSFAGDLVHTAQWDEKLCLKGKTVGVVGNGSTGSQLMTAIAPEVGSLVSFQRHPQYSVPSRQGLVPEGYREKINAKYDEIWEGIRNSFTGFDIPEVSRKTMEATPEERQKIFQEVWDQGNGFRFMFSTFGDLTINPEANEEACKFIRGKIKETVQDPRKANALIPHEAYARRPLCNSDYYDIFNRDNVDIVDLRTTQIASIVPAGIQMEDGTIHELDVLIFATGFDAVEGSFLRVQITGREGASIHQHWSQGPISYAGVTCAGFPNMFMAPGPQGPFANYPPLIESGNDFIMECILHAEKTSGVIEVLPEAEKEWSSMCEKLLAGSLFKTTASWLFGDNIKGRKQRTKFYFGGLKNYKEWTQNEVSSGFPSFWTTRPGSQV